MLGPQPVFVNGNRLAAKIFTSVGRVTPCAPRLAGDCEPYLLRLCDSVLKLV